MKQGVKLPSAPAPKVSIPAVSNPAASAKAPVPEVDAESRLRRAEALSGARSAYPDYLKGLQNASGYRAVDRPRDRPGTVRRRIGLEYNKRGVELDETLWASAETMLDLVEREGVEITSAVREVIADFDQKDAIFSDLSELIEVLYDRVGDIEEEEAPQLETISFYHGTDLKTAGKLAAGLKIDARGKGELGGGFYMTHDEHQAAHIADYYTGKEGRGTHWGVVQFDIPAATLQGTLRNKKVVTPDEFEEYWAQVVESGNQQESAYDWTIGPIKDRKTKYVQHLFAGAGLNVLNAKVTVRTLVLQGAVGTDKAKYSERVQGYDQDEDPILDVLLELEPAVEDTGGGSGSEDVEEVDYEALQERVEAALKAKNKRLTRNVIDELNEALEAAPGDKQILAWLVQLGS